MWTRWSNKYFYGNQNNYDRPISVNENNQLKTDIKSENEAEVGFEKTQTKAGDEVEAELKLKLKPKLEDE